MHYEARELAELAEAGWQFLQERKSGIPKIRFESRPGPMGAERVRSVSIIEMINDDMPFLLDSVMAELAAAERGRAACAASDLHGRA